MAEHHHKNGLYDDKHIEMNTEKNNHKETEKYWLRIAANQHFQNIEQSDDKCFDTIQKYDYKYIPVEKDNAKDRKQIDKNQYNKGIDSSIFP